MCYNIGAPPILCYIIAIVAGPLFLPFVFLSFLFKALTGNLEKENFPVRKSSTKK